MATRIRTLNFLPDVFQTTTNSQFLQATLDQIVDQPNLQRIQGYVGSKLGYGINANDYYVTEPSKVRTDYQLEPGVIFTNPNETTGGYPAPLDFITYPGINDSIALNGGLTDNNSRLYESDIYSWDSFTNLDTLINFNQYYWLPSGPPSVTVGAGTTFTQENYIVTDVANGYIIATNGSSSSINPTITLLRGGTYTFQVNQSTQFWIQGQPGVTGYSPTQPNLQTRDVYGVDNNGATQGVVTFNVPLSDAQDQYIFPGNNPVGVICTIPFSQVQGMPVSSVGAIDGVTALAGLTLMFYNTGADTNYGYLNQFYDTTTYDENGGVPYSNANFPGTSIYDDNYEGGYYTDTTSNFYTITYTGDPSNPIINLVPAGSIPINQNIVASYGTEYGSRTFYKNTAGAINLIPYLSADLDTLYYQDGTNPDQVGIIKLINSNITSTIDIDTEILGQLQYTSPNGVVFTNGLMVQFDNTVVPTSYVNNQYYVQGVGTGIDLVPVTDMLVPELASGATYIPYDTTPYDIGNYDSSLYVPVTPDYITIARDSIDRNAWSRSNRWFHIDVINATAIYNNDPTIATTYATPANKAKRPIIEFYPNLKLFNSGSYGKAPIDFVDTKTQDVFNEIAGHRQYYPDTASYSSYTATINGVSGPVTGIEIGYTSNFNNIIALSSGNTNGFNINDPIVFADSIGGLTGGATYYIATILSDTTFQVSLTANGSVLSLTYDDTSTTATQYPRSTTIQVLSSNVTGLLEQGQYIQDLYVDPAIVQVLPNTTMITNVVTDVYGNMTITVSWESNIIFDTQTDASIVTANTTLDNYQLFPGSRIIFTADNDINVRNKIYVVELSSMTPGSTPVITLTPAEDGAVLPEDLTVAFRGYNYAGFSFYFDGTNWSKAQTKTTVNQPPLFDIFDSNGVSLSDQSVYTSSSFAGTTLFQYTIGSGLVDSILGFPLQYSSTTDVGDIDFTATLNSDTFNYVSASSPITENINIGYVYSYPTLNIPGIYARHLGWQTTVSPSVQYQVFEFDYDAANPSLSFTCDVSVNGYETNWPVIQVFINNVAQTVIPYSAINTTTTPYDCTYTTTDTTTTVLFGQTISDTDTVVQVLLLSNQVSETAYYQVPLNLNNNPLNQELTTLNLGEIRGQYQSAFYNNPNSTGQALGPNNYRDLGNMVPWANKIIQNSSSLVLPGAFLRNQNLDLFKALKFNNDQYISYKSLLINTINNTGYNKPYTPAQILDAAMSQIALTKSQTGSFFWSDMLPTQTPYVSNTYTFANSLDTSIYPLSTVYNFASANYNGVLVYLTRNNITTQLIINVNYTVSSTAPSLTITSELLPGDVVTINEYNQTYGSYVPNTPTKLGLYPATIPNVFLDPNYQTPTYFIVGHDGSFTQLYGDYDPTTGTLNDYRDQGLLEFETRIYNNLKLSNVIPIQEYEIVPGFFRTTEYTYDEFLEIYSESFLNWVGQNRIQYKQQFYNRNNEFTFNYRGNGNKINQENLEIGYWRGIYQYFYDTSTPNITPWEMIGYRNMPAWWTNRYGPAPYTSENLVLWTDMQNGIDWNNGNPVVLEQYVRPGLLQVIPVDTAGNLLSPFDSILGNYNGLNFQKDWIVGDDGPAEFAFRRSSSWPFALMRIMALTKPAQFYNLAVDVDNYQYSPEFNQYLINNRSPLVLSDISIYGDGTPVTSYINWIVDYEKQLGVDATTETQDLLNNLDVRLVYRLAGFSDQVQLGFYLEKASPNSNNASLLVPDESYGILLYNNVPNETIIYSGVVVQVTSSGYSVFGNSQTQAYFTISNPAPTTGTSAVTVENVTVNIAQNYYDTTTIIPYGTTFYTLQEVSQFLASYGNYLSTQGVVFSDSLNALTIDWNQMVAEFLYWAQMGWDVGSIINLNPSAAKLEINTESSVVQPLTIQDQNFVLNQNLMPIDIKNLAIVRDGTDFQLQPLNQGDAISYGQFDLSTLEHGIVFNNLTLFNDVIYSLVTGLRQIRIYVRGARSAEWDGTMDAQGFIINQDNITEWDPTVKYTKGSIVLYKNKYWSATTIVQPNTTFIQTQWQLTTYNNIQKGLLPNSSTNSYEATLYYNTNQTNLKTDADLLSFSLIGYRPRDYMALADLTNITQVNVYQNLIQNKGTLNAASAFNGATLPQGGIEYELYQNWAIQTGEFGGLLNNNFMEVVLNQALLPNNPSTIALTNGYNDIDADMEIPLYSIYNYQRPITNPNILSTLPSETPSVLYPDAGYVNFNDVKLASYYYSNLPNGVNQFGVNIPISQVYARDYIWLANFLQTWQVFTPISLGTIVLAQNNLNNTVTITFTEPQTLTQYQPFAIVNFNPSIDGYYIVGAVVNPYKVIINLSLPPAITKVTGLGVAFGFQSQRVSQPSDIANLPLLNNEFIQNKVWVDTNTDGSWAVYRKTINYGFQSDFSNLDSVEFGSAVAYTDQAGYLVGDSGLGVVYRFNYLSNSNTYEVRQTLTGNTSFGSYISYSGNTFVISEPTGNVYVYELVVTTLEDQINLVQTIPAVGSTTSWGASTAISGDTNWIYIGDPNNNIVYVYRMSQATGTYLLVNTLTDSGSVSGDQFGTSVTTDYYGDTVVIGAPNKSENGLSNVGYAYVYQRLSQNFSAPYTSTPFVPQVFNLASAPTTVTKTATATSGYNITVSSLTGVSVGNPVVFTGSIISGGALQANTVYYVVAKSTSTFQVSLTRGGSPISLATGTGTMTCNFQTVESYINVNGNLLTDNQYAVIGTTLNIYASLTIGDIVNISTSNFTEIQTLSSGVTYNIGEQFGQSVDTTSYADEIIVGAPFALDLAHDANQEGAVFRYTNGGSSYGMIIGTNTCATTTNRTILLNGYAVTITAGNAENAANIINEANITNITASGSTGVLIIALNNSALAIPNQQLTLQVTNEATLAELGISIYTQTQTIVCPHSELHSKFGYALKYNEFGSFVATAPTSARYANTTFDFTDDGIDNDTVFDNNTTTWVDSFVNAGAAYMFDYLSNYNETLTNVGSYVYAQSVNSEELEYGNEPFYGTSVDFNNSTVIVGTPYFEPGVTNGLVTVYTNNTTQSDWAVFEQSGEVVDIDSIQNAQLYSQSTNNTLVNLDYIDPLQGKILGAVRQNLDYISNADPASYNSQYATTGNRFWGADKVGTLWFNTSNTRFMNYHQQDYLYNNKWWGLVFPGSDVSVYSFITSNVEPSFYKGPGTVFNVDSYSVSYVPNQSGTLTPVYFYWVRNTNIVFNQANKTLSDTVVEGYIANPQTSGISYFTPVSPNAFTLYNCLDYINATDTILHIGYSTGSGETVQHSQFQLIRENYADDFLPGLPSESPTNEPSSLYEKFLDSSSGLDRSGAVVPDPTLPVPVQNGILVRPRQSFFYDRLGALENIIEFANSIIIQYPFNEILNTNFLYEIGPINPSTGQPFYNVGDYVENVNWWAPGYNDNTQASIQVPLYANLAGINVPQGTIASVAQNGEGLQETYVSNGDGTWTRIGLQYGTVQISSAIYDYADNSIGFGNNYFDTQPYDSFPSEETRYILRAFCEELPPDLLIARNEMLILLFQYIENEALANNNLLPWLNKTSFLDVVHTIGELLPLLVYQSDNEQFLEGYLNEVKPYHVVIKDFVFRYTGTDVFEGDITDFDVPASYDNSLQQYIAPELVYTTPTEPYQFLPTDPIWQSGLYSQWYQNYGVSIVGQDNFYITNVASYLALNTTSFMVDNASGFPINGVITIDSEQIAYSSVNQGTNIISGLTRGYNGTAIANHIPGAQVYIDLPPVLLLYGGRGYTEPPKVTAYIDTTVFPAPRQEAVLTAVMSFDSVNSVTVTNPGIGYAALPTIVFDPAFVVPFTDSNVTIATNTIQLTSNLLETGDIATYTAENPIAGLVSGQYYYVNVLEIIPVVSVALYTNYKDCILDQNRIVFYNTGSGSQTLSVGAIASCISSAYPVRENNITIKFDRTTYNSQVIDWEPAGYYGSFYAGATNYRFNGSSSDITLESTAPDINTVLASASGESFEIIDVENVETITWSSMYRNVVGTYGSTDPLYPNTIQIIPGPTGAPVEGTVGSTVGFYIGMPIQFTGETFSTIQVDTTYYVAGLVEIFNADADTLQSTGFKIATTYDNAIAGIVVSLTTGTAPAAGLLAYPGQLNSQAVLTIDYSGIRQATQTNASNNAITVPITSTGFGGTQGLYTGAMIFFVGDTFGGVVENEIYYVTSIIDDQTFTFSTEQTPIQTQVYGTLGSTDPQYPNCVVCETNVEFNVNDPIIFNPFNVYNSSTGVTTTYDSFGGINAGQVYYVNEIVNSAHFTISDSPNSTSITLTAFTPTANPQTYSLLIDQIDVLPLTTSTGSMSVNINLPVSPGQINGQQFTLYNTSGYYTSATPTNLSNLFTTNVTQVLGEPYTHVINRVIINATTLSQVNQVYNNMPIQLDTTIGGLTEDTTYYVINYGITTVNITSTSSTGNVLTCDRADYLFSGMPITFTGGALGGVLNGVEYYVDTVLSSTTFTISESVGGSAFPLTNQSGTMVGSGAVYLQVSSTSGGSSVTLSDASPSGTVNLTQYFTESANLAISYILGGYSVYIINGGTGYAIGNELVYSGSQLGGTSPANDLTVTVNTIDSNGSIQSLIRSGTPAGNTNQYYLGVVDLNQVAVFSDPNLTIPVSGINFPYNGVTSTTVTTLSSPDITVTSIEGFNLNDPVVFTGTSTGNMVAGQTYYIKTLSPLTVSETLEGSAFNTGTGTGFNFTMAKIGDFALLPEPFYFNQSIVKFNNQVYRCIVSNNDNEFIFGKWEQLDSGSTLLNAMDRTIGYYQPTINMPGVDLSQLFTGVTYPNSTYKGNAFPPDQLFELDTVLTDQPFYPTEVNMASVIWNGSNYVAAANTPTYSTNVISAPGNTWVLDNLSNSPISVTSIYYTPVTNTYIVTANNAATPILVSNDGVTWITQGAFTPFDSVAYSDINFDVSSTSVPSTALYATVYYNGVYYCVGENIVYSLDTYSWTQTYAAPTNTSMLLKDVNYFNIPNYTGFIAVGSIVNLSTLVKNEYVISSQDGYTWSNLLPSPIANNGLNSITTNGTYLVAVGDNGTIYFSVNGSNWANYTIGSTPNLNKIAYGNGKYVIVGDLGTILTSTSGQSWTSRTSGVTDNLYGVTYNSTDNTWLAVGNDNVILSSTDTITWTITSLFQQAPTTYTVQGDAFTAGYAPEELVAGVVSDSLTMIVNTRPGTDWDPTVYQHVGYEVVSEEITPTSGTQTVYSFAGIVQVPSQLKVFVINNSTGLSTTLYPTEYAINWIEQTIILDTPIGLTNTLRVDVYATGNGDQLVKSNTLLNPIRINSSTGFSEIYVNCNYSAPIYSGSGIIQPGTQPIDTFATQTNSSDNSIVVQNIKDFVINSPIYFEGDVFGGVQENVTYYVKTISIATSSITISDQYNTQAGIAGPTFPLTDATGLMDTLVQLQNGTTWTDPIIYYNGNKLLPGHTMTVTKTNSGTNTIECNSTNAIIVGEQVVFSGPTQGVSIFGDSVLLVGKIYYIQSIVSPTQFTVSATQGGSVLELNDASGGSSCIVADYGFGIQPNGTSAKLIFAGKPDTSNPGFVTPYVDTTDYITYTLFGQTEPAQYGYTIPQTQYIVGNGVTESFSLNNYVGGDNPTNAIVEINGLRLTSGYTISSSSNSITFASAPANGATISVTTYNLTDNQYLYTQYDVTGNTVSSIISINNTITSPQAEAVATATSGTNITVGTPSGTIIVGSTVYFQGTSFGGIAVDGTVYYVVYSSGSTIRVSATSGGSAITWTTASGTLEAVFGGQPAVRITTANAHGFTTNNIVRIDGTGGSVQLNNNTYYVHVINSTQFDLYTTEYSAGLGYVNTPVTEISSYIGGSGGYAWLDGSYIISDTTVSSINIDNQVLVATGGAAGFIPGTPIVFTQEGTPFGQTVIGNIVAGTVYYVYEQSDVSAIRISATHDGPVLSLTAASASGNPINVTQWQQTNVDRLWVTVNGYRVPSSNLNINPGNYLSILTAIQSSDVVVISSTMPSATPNQETYIQSVSNTGSFDIYRQTIQNTTWLTAPLLYTDSVISVQDASSLIDIVTQTNIAPAPVDGVISVGVNADKNLVSAITVFNNTTNLLVTSYQEVIVDLALTLQFTSGVSAGDSLTITSTVGNLIYVNGEQIIFGSVDLENNTLSNLTRGVNGTGVQTYTDVYSTVFGILSKNRLPDTYYNETWNSNVYNETLGDPLQISDTYAATFLNQGQS